ncbi:menaquinol-cytochrome c reductase cytochrome b subunit [Halarchaeum grantii]|uniref:Menaquinol-cytochrome c reductase cytochrome b subunit n=1 Tax=Halarchaeum grantii TaxID=1193105 RepID=A0A830F5Y5_9EURY|nr:cytochrome bc complex cytochrome b subunit [Halarchaeum grantii]GGL42428.1 menaquinol-cytochrome c reductase cytochrome b subunit [Halarchaeum grantii]
MGRLTAWVSERFETEVFEPYLGKSFPAEDSFLLGEVALFSFVVLVLTGTYLGLFYIPSIESVTYHGSVVRYQGQELPGAFASVLQLTYDVPFGMFVRRFHHWAAHIFVASIALHMLRVFFTGAYRKPREANWAVGVVLAALAMLAAYTGYSLPFDEFATTATSIGFNLASSIPLLGDFLAQLVFGGDYPTNTSIPRLYFLHVFVVPLLIAGFIALHMAILVHQKHTEAAREDDVETSRGTVERDDGDVVIGLPAVPNQTAVSAVVFFLTVATTSLLAGFLPVHNVAEYGPHDPASTPAVIMPDWFLMWVYGFLKLWPTWLNFSVAGFHFSPEFLAGVGLSGLVFLAVFAWPFVRPQERSVHFTADPLARPVATAVGVAGVLMVMIASIAGMNNLLANLLGVGTGPVNTALTIAIFVWPTAGALATYYALRGDDPADRTVDERPADD